MRVSCHRICLGSHPLLRAYNFHLHVCLCSYFHCWCTFLWETVKIYARAAERGKNFIIVTFVGCWLSSKGWAERFLFSYPTFKKDSFCFIPHFVQYKAEGKHKPGRGEDGKALTSFWKNDSWDVRWEELKIWKTDVSFWTSCGAMGRNTESQCLHMWKDRQHEWTKSSIIPPSQKFRRERPNGGRLSNLRVELAYS